jgi:hypothetical protein
MVERQLLRVGVGWKEEAAVAEEVEVHQDEDDDLVGVVKVGSPECWEFPWSCICEESRSSREGPARECPELEAHLAEMVFAIHRKDADEATSASQARVVS